MINLRRPLGLKFLLMTLLTTGLLTSLLVYMVWNRVSLLQNGVEVTLKSAPVDPRALLRGYYVRLTYQISTLTLERLPQYDPKVIGKGFEKNSRIYVKLSPQDGGFFAPVSVHRDIPPLVGKQVFIRGRVKYRVCTPSKRVMAAKCRLPLYYGIEKFFAPQQQAKRLERLRNGDNQQIAILDRRIAAVQQQQRRERLVLENGTAERIAKLQEQLKELRRSRQQLILQDREAMGARFAILVRLSPDSGEAAISGLQLDGKKIYEERLF